MPKFVVFGEKGAGSSVKGRILLAVIIILGAVFLFFFFFAAIALAVVLIPAGILLYLFRKVFLPGQKPEEEPRAETDKNTGGTEIIDVTDYETVEENVKQLKE